MPGTDNSDGHYPDPSAQFDHGLAVTRDEIPGRVRVAFAGELDLLSVPTAVDALRDGHQHAGDVILDLRELGFMDAAGLAVILNAGHRARRAGRSFVIHVRSPGVRRLLALTRAERTLEIVADDTADGADPNANGASASSELPGTFGWDVIRDETSVRVALWGEIDLAARPHLDPVIDDVTQSGIGLVILDLRRVSFLDSNGLRMALELYAASRGDGFALQLVPGPPHIQRVFEVTGTLDALPFVTGEPGAAADVRE